MTDEPLVLCRRAGCPNPVPPSKRKDRPRLFCSDRCRAFHRLEAQRKALADVAAAADAAADELDRLRATLVGLRQRVQAMVGRRRMSADPRTLSSVPTPSDGKGQTNPKDPPSS